MFAPAARAPLNCRSCALWPPSGGLPGQPMVRVPATPALPKCVPEGPCASLQRGQWPPSMTGQGPDSAGRVQLRVRVTPELPSLRSLATLWGSAGSAHGSGPCHPCPAESASQRVPLANPEGPGVFGSTPAVWGSLWFSRPGLGVPAHGGCSETTRTICGSICGCSRTDPSAPCVPDSIRVRL